MIRFNHHRFWIGAVGLILVSLCFMGCSKITPKNLRKLNSGMTYAEVKKVVGDADDCKQGIFFKNCDWKEGDKSLRVKFLSEKVFLFFTKNV
jgi:hypothetical protein